MDTQVLAPPTAAGTPESLESLRAQRDELAAFIRKLAAENHRTMTLRADDHRTALELLDSLPVPERCLNAAPGAPDGGHAFFLPVEGGKRCMNCRTLRLDPAPASAA
ncbi:MULTISPECIES: hypothetical protein [Streptomyces]|uniref:hypothetical protein n=1 Tax=Streptomyces TaxID=1883 RepID=UPI000E67CA95|nr:MULTISPECIES: hypothetical protein [Streptomyces]MDX3069412.1 hypothetical protein [Streptomyces sp. ND04-05B]MDX3519458.1 hypothetical protein [Streptomyces scabiei]